MNPIAQLLDSFRDLGRRVGVRMGRPLKIKINGRVFYLNAERNAVYHASNSTGKLVRMVDVIESAGCILDVGANCGLFSGLCAMRFPGSDIHAFEPSSDLLPVLRANCEGLGVSIHSTAVGETSGEVTFFINPHSQQTNSIERSAVEAFSQGEALIEVQVPCTTLDAFARAEGISRVDVLKIDVQGFEGPVLRGARNLLPGVSMLFLETTWLDVEGVQRILPAAEHYGFTHVTIVNPVYTGADLLFTREPLRTATKDMLQFKLGSESAGSPWF